MKTKEYPRRFKFSNERLLAAVKAGLRGELRDESYSDFTAWIAADLTISFRYRPRIDGKRPPFPLKDFNPDLDPATGKAVFGVEQAHAAAGRAKADYLNKVTSGRLVEKKKISPTLSELIGFPEVRSRGHHSTVITPKIVGIYERERVAGNVKVRNKSEEEAKVMPAQWHQNMRDLRRIYKPLLNKRVDELTREEVAATEKDFLDAVEEARGHRPESVRNIARTYLLLILEFAARSRFMTAEEFLGESSKQSKERDRYLLPGEWQRVSAALNELDERHPLTGMFLRFAVYQGVRIAMLAQMRWDQMALEPFTVDGVTHEILVWRYKGGRGSGLKKAPSAVLPIVGRARELYDELAKLCPDEKSRKRQPTVFPQEVSQRWTRNSHQWAPSLMIQSLTKLWTRHDLRRTHATFKEALGIPKTEISIALCHSRKKKKESAHHNSTPVYTKGPAADFVQLAEGYVRLHTLLDHMEHGVLTTELERIQQNLQIDEIATDLIHNFNLDRADIRIVVNQDRRQRPRLVYSAA